MKITRRQLLIGIAAGIVLIVAALLVLRFSDDTTVTFRLIHQDRIVNADLWSDQPEILSAGYGFDNIIGVEGGEAEVRAAGGTWNAITCATGAEPPREALTSSALPSAVERGFDHTAAFADGLPVVFSYPVVPSTVDHTDFRVTLNTGEIVTPQAAGIIPNWEYNERSVVVIFGDFGNRQLPGEPDARYAIRVEVVADSTPLLLVGRAGTVSAVGLSRESDSSPYVSGPYLVGAKLTRMSTEGEGGPALFNSVLPNDGQALYGDAAQYRLRMYTSGGFSPDGVRGILPTEYARFFRIHALAMDGSTVLLTETGVDYAAAGGTIRVEGLADLGVALADGAYDDCYDEDHDNYIDVILSGDEAAMHSITFLEVPATGDYDPLYNPGGPGNNPTPGVRYSAASPPDLQPVTIALDDPLTVSYGN